MARPLRIAYPGALYHITTRGNARASIFKDDTDRQAFLGILSKVIERHQWRCHAYCLMGNHYHLLIETPEANLSPGMRQLNGIYTQAFNRRHVRVGHVLQGRFKAILVDKDSYLLELCRYIVLNPVRANMVKLPKSYPWSSYRASAGLSRSASRSGILPSLEAGSLGIGPTSVMPPPACRAHKFHPSASEIVTIPKPKKKKNIVVINSVQSLIDYLRCPQIIQPPSRTG